MSLPDTPDWTLPVAAVRSKKLLCDLIYEYLERDVGRLNGSWEELRMLRRRGSGIVSWGLDRAAGGQTNVYILGRGVDDNDHRYGLVEVDVGVIRLWTEDQQRREAERLTFCATCKDNGELTFADSDQLDLEPWQVSRAILERVIFADAA